ncbi:MAG: hypothetical protein IJ804_06720 [Prevotella sp.]|nr:hypothetical protein [Prevotella sp.]
MKKIAYKVPEMVTVKLVNNVNLLTASGGSGATGEQGGEGNIEEPLD